MSSPPLKRRPKLDRAAAHLAQHLGMTLRDGQALDLLDDMHTISGYISYRWRLLDAQGQEWGMIDLRCQGGYGAEPKGPGWFKGTVSVMPDSGNISQSLNEVLVHQWDFPGKGVASAKATKDRFVDWVRRLTAQPVSQPKPPRP